jgi:hypothetical protein
VVDVRRDGKRLFISQSSLKRLVAQEARWSNQHDLFGKSQAATVPALAVRAQLYASCFISYSTKDQDFVGRLYSDLQSHGVSCWYAPHHAKGGQKLDDQIERGIDMHDRTLLVLSKNTTPLTEMPLLHHTRRVRRASGFVQMPVKDVSRGWPTDRNRPIVPSRRIPTQGERLRPGLPSSLSTDAAAG